MSEITVVICEHERGSNRMVYPGFTVGLTVTVSISGSETFSYQIYKVIALFDFFTYLDKSHIA